MKSEIRFFILLLSLCAFGGRAEQCSEFAAKWVSDGQMIEASADSGICKVVVRIWPKALSTSKNSFIDVTVWLPEKATWNERFVGLGNGGYSPSLPISAMQQQVNNGYMVAATDTGHKSESMDFMVEANERIDYWGRISVHALSTTAKAVSRQYYGKAPKYSYFAGCSTGGHQAMTAAQYYPEAYDGIVAGAPGNNRVALNAAFLWLFQQTHSRQNQLLFGKKDLKLLSDAAFRQCDAIDGKSDGLISDIERCKPSPEKLQCMDGETEDCLSEEQVARAKMIYQGPVDPVTGESIYPGFPPGSEFAGGVGWSAYWADPQEPSRPARADFWHLWVFPERENFSLWDFDWHHDFRVAKARLSDRIDAIHPDLSVFTQKGRKLLIFHGLADPVVSATDTLIFYQRIREYTQNSENVQLYLVPGMSHCQGGSSVTNVDWLTPLVNWSENGGYPESVTGWGEGRKKVELPPYKN